MSIDAPFVLRSSCTTIARTCPNEPQHLGYQQRSQAINNTKRYPNLVELHCLRHLKALTCKNWKQEGKVVVNFLTYKNVFYILERSFCFMKQCQSQRNFVSFQCWSTFLVKSHSNSKSFLLFIRQFHYFSRLVSNSQVIFILMTG